MDVRNSMRQKSRAVASHMVHLPVCRRGFSVGGLVPDWGAWACVAEDPSSPLSMKDKR